MLKHNNLNDKYLSMQKIWDTAISYKILASLFLLNFIKSESGRLELASKMFRIVHVDENGQYGIWAKSYSGKYVPLDEELIKIIKR